MRLSPEDIQVGEWASEEDERLYWLDFSRFGTAVRQLTPDGRWQYVTAWDLAGEEVTADG